MTPVSDNMKNIVLHCTCPDCGKKFDLELTMPAEFASIFLEYGERMLCATCGELKEVERTRRAIEQAELELMEDARIPFEFQRWDVTKGNTAITDWVTENKQGNLLLIGEVNTGKTRSMAKVLIDELNAGKSVLFYDFTEFAEDYAEAMQESIHRGKKFLQSVVNGGYDIVLLDDLDKHRINETAGNCLYKIFNNLYSGDITSKMWFTMNHRGKEFLNHFDNRDYGAAVVSRIARMMEDHRFHVKHIEEIITERKQKEQ